MSAPTLLDEVFPSMRVAREELFGPVLSVIPGEDEEATFEAVNESSYGLAAAVYARDVSTAIRASHRVQGTSG